MDDRTALSHSTPNGRDYFGDIVDSVMDAIISIDQAHQIILFNKAAEHMFGCAEAQALGQPIDLFIPQRFRAEHDAAIDEFGKTHSSRRKMGALGVVYGLRANHEEFPIEASISQTETSGKIIYTVILRDITTQRQAEMQAAQATERLRVLADAYRIFAEAGTGMQSTISVIAQVISESLGCLCLVKLLDFDRHWLEPVAVFDEDAEKSRLLQKTLADSTWKVSVDEPAFQHLKQLQPIFIPIVGQNHADTLYQPKLLPIPTALDIHSYIAVPLALPRRLIGTLTLIRYKPNLPPFSQDDLRLAQSLADRAAIAIDNAELLAQAQEEIAIRKEVEAALENERTLLAQRVAERTSALQIANEDLTHLGRQKDEFLANVSHELRTPLNAILGQSQLMLESIHGPLTPKQENALHIVENSGQHLLNLINDILDISRMDLSVQKLDLEWVALNELCNACTRMLAEKAQHKHVKLATTLDQTVDILYCDARRLKQILMNLLVNAIKFTDAGGKVTLEVIGDETANTVTFSVIDTGIGIAETDLARLFRPFVQLDSGLNRQFEGTGLGLALVRRLVEAHQGSITVQSTLGKGSRFVVILPWRHAL